MSENSKHLEMLWANLERTRTGMLVVDDSGQHPQPMTHYVDRSAGALWFIAASDSDLAQAVGHGALASFSVASSSDGFYASLRGTLSVSKENEKLDELWSYAAAAWFEQGRDDPKVRLLRFTPREAAVWETDDSTVVVAFKMMRAAMSDTNSYPDVGSHRVFAMNDAA